MGDIEWKPLPTGLWTPPAVFAEVGNLLLQAFTDDGVPTWEISKKTEELWGNRRIGVASGESIANLIFGCHHPRIPQRTGGTLG